MQAGAAGQVLQNPPQLGQIPLEGEPDAPDNPQAYDEQIRTAYQQLNTMLTQSYPEVDFASKYKDLISEVENQPETQQTNPALAFAYAMGAPDKAPQILHEKMNKIDDEHSAKEAKLLKLKEDILTNTIQQELQKGNFKQALSQSEKLAEIQKLNKDRDSAAAMRDWKAKQRIKTNDAKSVLTRRVEALAANFHLDEKMKLALLNHGMSLVQALAGKTDIFGNSSFNEEATTDLVDRVFPALFELAREQGGKKKEKDQPAATTPDAPPAKTETPLQKSIRLQREKKAGQAAPSK